MANRTWLAWCVGLVVLAPLSALALPARVLAQSPALLPVQGYLTDDAGQPIEGTHTITASLFDKSFSGTKLFSETTSGVMVEAGAFVLYVGGVGTPVFDLALFATHDEVWLELEVDSDVIEPRFRLGSVPYAAYASSCGDAQTVGGLDATQLATSDHAHAFSDLTGLPAGLADGDDADALGGLSCTTGFVAVSSGGGNWTCVALSASNISTGTLDTARYSAYADLAAEGYLNGDASDLLTYSAGDGRYAIKAIADTDYMPANRFSAITSHTVTATVSSTNAVVALNKTFCALTRVKQTGSAGECVITQSGTQFTLSATAGTGNDATCEMRCF